LRLGGVSTLHLPRPSLHKTSFPPPHHPPRPPTTTQPKSPPLSLLSPLPYLPSPSLPPLPATPHPQQKYIKKNGGLRAVILGGWGGGGGGGGFFLGGGWGVGVGFLGGGCVGGVFLGGFCVFFFLGGLGVGVAGGGGWRHPTTQQNTKPKNPTGLFFGWEQKNLFWWWVVGWGGWWGWFPPPLTSLSRDKIPNLSLQTTEERHSDASCASFPPLTPDLFCRPPPPLKNPPFTFKRLNRYFL